MPIDTRHPREIRADIRSGKLRGITAGLGQNFVQANLAVLPKDHAYDFLLFCQRNPDRKSTRLNSSHGYISYAVFCLKKKKTIRLDNVYTTLLFYLLSLINEKDLSFYTVPPDISTTLICTHTPIAPSLTPHLILPLRQ